jgi:hypothetical protein
MHFNFGVYLSCRTRIELHRILAVQYFKCHMTKEIELGWEILICAYNIVMELTRIRVSLYGRIIYLLTLKGRMEGVLSANAKKYAKNKLCAQSRHLFPCLSVLSARREKREEATEAEVRIRLPIWRHRDQGTNRVPSLSSAADV